MHWIKFSLTYFPIVPTFYWLNVIRTVPRNKFTKCFMHRNKNCTYLANTVCKLFKNSFCTNCNVSLLRCQTIFQFQLYQQHNSSCYTIKHKNSISAKCKQLLISEIVITYSFPFQHYFLQLLQSIIDQIIISWLQYNTSISNTQTYNFYSRFPLNSIHCGIYKYSNTTIICTFLQWN